MVTALKEQDGEEKEEKKENITTQLSITSQPNALNGVT